MDAQVRTGSSDVSASQWIANERPTFVSESQQPCRESCVEWLLGLGIIVLLVSAGIYFLALSPYVIRAVMRLMT